MDIVINTFAVLGGVIVGILGGHTIVRLLGGVLRRRTSVDVLAVLWVAADAIRDAAPPHDPEHPARKTLETAHRQIMDAIGKLQHGGRPTT